MINMISSSLLLMFDNQNITSIIFPQLVNLENFTLARSSILHIKILLWLESMMFIVKHGKPKLQTTLNSLAFSSMKSQLPSLLSNLRQSKEITFNNLKLSTQSMELISFQSKIPSLLTDQLSITSWQFTLLVFTQNRLESELSSSMDGLLLELSSSTTMLSGSERYPTWSHWNIFNKP